MTIQARSLKGVCASLFVLASNSAFAYLPCVGNGRVDDTACLNAEFSRTGAGTVTLDPGRHYVINGPLTLPPGVSIDGAGSTISSQNKRGLQWFKFLSVGSNSSIRNLNFVYDLPRARSNWAAVVIEVSAYAQSIQIENIRVKGPKILAAVKLTAPGIHDVSVRSSQFRNMGYPIFINNHPRSPAERIHDITVAANLMENLSDDGVIVNSPVLVNSQASGKVNLSAYNVTIVDNTIRNIRGRSFASGFCIDIAGGKNIQILRNHLSNCSWNGIHLEDTATNIDIRDNVVKGVYRPNPRQWVGQTSGIKLVNSRDIRVVNNFITGAMDNGIEVGWNPLYGYDPRKITVMNNTVRRSGRYGIKYTTRPGQSTELYSKGNDVQGSRAGDLCVTSSGKSFWVIDRYRDVCR